MCNLFGWNCVLSLPEFDVLFRYVCICVCVCLYVCVIAVKKYQEIVRSSAIPGNGINKEYALSLLQISGGDIKVCSVYVEFAISKYSMF